MEESLEDTKKKLVNRGSKIIGEIIALIQELNDVKISFWRFLPKRNFSNLESKYNSLYVQKYIPYNKDITALSEQLINAREITNSKTNQVEPVDLNTRALFFIYTSELSSQKDYIRTLFQEFRSKIENYNSKIQNKVSLAIGFLALIVAIGSLCFAAKQTQDTKNQMSTLSSITMTANQTQESTKKAVSEQLTINLDTRLSDQQNTAILKAISEKNDPVKTFSQYQVDNYLAVYEILDVAYKNDLVSDNDFCNMFSDGLLTTFENKNIQNYIKTNQKIDSKYYAGFDHLAGVAYKICK